MVVAVTPIDRRGRPCFLWVQEPGAQRTNSPKKPMKKLLSLAMVALLGVIAGCEKSAEDKAKDAAGDAAKAAGDAAKAAGDAAKDAVKK